MATSLSLWQQAERLLSAGQVLAATRVYVALLDDPAWALPARLRLSVLALSAGRVRAAVEHALGAYAIREDDPVLLEELCRRLLDVGELEAAVECVRAQAITNTSDAQVLAGMGKLMSDQSLPELALPLFRRARALGLQDVDLGYQIGLSAMYLGDIETAEAELERCLAIDPGHAPAHRSLARLRTQTPSRNHVDRLRAALARCGDSNSNAPMLYYALFKELDDLGDTEAAWPALAAGMRLRRRQVTHDAAYEQRLFSELHRVGPGRGDSALPAVGSIPIFIVGMPRSGTTLLERVLGAHPLVTDAGELRDFVCQLRWACNHAGRHHLDWELVQAAADIDWAELGRRYLMHSQWRARGRPFYTDKLPANFVSVGYIAKALPQARIIHMVREPMDSCFSNLKELFGEAYPHSYDQIEMAEHYLSYRQLMAHWHEAFPGRVLDVHYESLVTDPKAVARQVLDYCGLPWDEAVLAIESRTGTVATASTVQVREPIHRRFLGQWRAYEKHLQPLRERLGGIEALLSDARTVRS